MLSTWCVRDCKKVILFQTHQQNWFLLIKRRWSCILSAMFTNITHSEETLKNKVQSRRRDYITSLRILIKQSNSWESSLIHLDSRQAECEWGSSNHLESWMDTKDKGLWNQENARRGYRIYNIMACFHKICVIYLWVSRGTDISLSMEPRGEPWFSWASTALICTAREQICSLH